MKLRAAARRLARIVRRGSRRIERALDRRSAGAAAGAVSAAPVDDGSPEMNVLFVGGTGRSGTSITARVLGLHRAYARIPIETRFISGRGGLCDLAAGDTTLREFEAAILHRWFDADPVRGLHLILDRPTIEAALPILRAGYASDPWAAGRRFVHALFDPFAIAAKRPGWIEKFPVNVRKADALYRMFPNMRIIHSIRDGRDSAASVTGLGWGPDDLDRALDWWARKVEQGFAACDRIPADRVHVVQLEDLVARHRDREYERLLAFLGLDDDPAMRMFFNERVTAEKAHVGRWRQDVPEDQQARFAAHHDRLAAELKSRGRPYEPYEEPALAAAG